MKNPKTVRMEPHDVKIEHLRPGYFSLVFVESRDGALLTVRVEMPDAWLSYLSEFAGQVVAYRIKTAADLKATIEARFHEESKKV